MTPGQQIRDFIDVKDVVRILLDNIYKDKIVYGKPLISNIGSGNPKTVLQFCKEWWEKFNAKGNLKPGTLKYRADEIMRLVPDIISENQVN